MDTIDSSSRCSNLSYAFARNAVENDHDDVVNVVASSWMCASGLFMDAILHRDDVDTKECVGPTSRETMLRSKLKCSPGERKDDISAIHRGTANSSETDMYQLTDRIKQIMEDSSRSNRSKERLAEKLEAVNMNRSRNYRDQQNNSHGDRFWRNDGVWSSDQTTTFGSVQYSTQHLPEVNCEQRKYIQARAESGWRLEVDRPHGQATKLRANEATNQAKRRADIGKAYAQAQQEKVGSKSSFWQSDYVWSSDQSTAFDFGSAPNSTYLRPHVNDYDEVVAVASARHLSFNDDFTSTGKQGADTSNCWRAAIDVSSGRTYYYNAETNESSWSLPSASARDDERRQTLRQKQLGCEVHMEEKRKERGQYWVSQTQTEQSRRIVAQEDGKKKKKKKTSRLHGFSLLRKKRSERSSSIKTSSSSPARLASHKHKHKLTIVSPDPASPGGTAGTSLSSSFDHQDDFALCTDHVVTRFSC
mmetsp:Transcript_2877/g.4420  ORF Transcript_2877/g.4420 Transcript_2877/m.4420 type:complete len:474 (-) Transcript_2877:274-1695(-)